MRTATASEIAALTSAARVDWLQVLIETPDHLALADLSAYVDEVEIEEDIDQPVAQATIKMRRDWDAATVQSLSPLRSDSTLNRDGGGAFAPKVDVARFVRIRLWVSAPGTVPGAGDWQTAFEGTIDQVELGEPMRLTCRGLGAELVDEWYTTARNLVADGNPAQPIETVLQTLLDDAGVFVGFPPVRPTLYTPVTSGQSITRFGHEREPAMDALTRLAQSIGGDFRYRWDAGTASYRPTFSTPDRAKTVADAVIAANQIVDLSRCALDRIPVRNAVAVSYQRAGTGAQRTVTVRDDASVSTYGERTLAIVEASDSPIDSDSEALAFATAVLADTKDPKAEQEVELLLDWRLELWDVLEFAANGIEYDSAQTLAVVNVRHQLSRDACRTLLRVRGTPAGSYTGWLARAAQRPSGATQGGTDPVAAPTATLTETSNTLTQVALTGAGVAAPGATDGALQWRSKTWADNTWPEPDYGAWAAFPATFVVARNPVLHQRVRFQVMDPDGRISEPVEVQILAKRDFLDTVTGKPKRSYPWDDGGYGATATDTSGYLLHPSAKDGSGTPRVLTSMFQRSVDSLDLVLQGTTQRWLGGASVDGSNRPLVDFALAAHSNKNLDNVADTAGFKRLTAAARTQLLARRPAHGGNLLSNPSWEDGQAFWASGSGVAVVTDSTRASTGNAYLQLTAAPGAYCTSSHVDETGQLRYFEVSPGDVVQLSVQCARESGDAPVAAVIALTDKDYANPNYFTTTPRPTSAAYLSSVIEVTVPAGKKYLYCYAQVGNTGTVPTVGRYDEAVLKILKPATDVLAGSLRSGMGDSGARALTSMFQRSVDSLDLVLQGTTQRWLRSASVDASNRPLVDLSLSGHLNRTLAYVSDDATSDRRAATANEKTGGQRGFGGFSNATGALVSTATDSGARVLTSMFQRSVDHLGLVLDGGGFQRPTTAQVAQVQQPSQNLLGPDAGATRVVAGSLQGGFYYSYGYGADGSLTITALGLRAGDTITGSFEAAGHSGGGDMFAELAFYDGAGNFAGSVDGGVLPATAVGGTARATVTATIPSTAARLVLYAVSHSAGNQVIARAMLNRGPMALPFNEPPFRPVRETAANVARTPTDTRTVADLTSRLLGNGNADTPFGDSGNRALTSMFQRSVDHLGLVLDGGGFQRPTTTQVGYADRAGTGLDASGAITQALPAGIKQANALGTVQVLAKGRLTGTCAHGATVVFPANFFSTIPMMLIRPALFTEPRAKWGPVGDGSETGAFDATKPIYPDIAASGLNVNGFTMRARLMQKTGTPTARSHSFSATPLTTVGATAAVTTSFAPAANDTYTAKFAASVTAGDPGGSFQSNTVTLVVALDYLISGGSWTECASFTISARATSGASKTTTNSNVSLSATVPFLASTSQCRLRVKDITFDGVGGGGASVTPDTLTYSTATSQYASQTPDAGDVVVWDAWEVNSAS